MTSRNNKDIMVNDDPELISDVYKRKYVSRLLDSANAHLENSFDPKNEKYIEASLESTIKYTKAALCILNSDELDKYDPEICRWVKETYVYR